MCVACEGWEWGQGEVGVCVNVTLLLLVLLLAVSTPQSSELAHTHTHELLPRSETMHSPCSSPICNANTRSSSSPCEGFNVNCVLCLVFHSINLMAPSVATAMACGSCP